MSPATRRRSGAPTSSVAPSGAEMVELMRRLSPLHRSITGDGVRETLRIVSEWAPADIREVPSGTSVYDWTVPPEWNVREAWIADGEGRRIVDLAWSTLHVMGYSTPIRARMRGSELREHLHRHPESPEWIPYVTSYYEPDWGFCVRGGQYDAVREDGDYEVVVDASVDERGSLTYGEHVVPGRESGEILISTYICHPSTCNDNLSGIAVAAALARALEPGVLRLTVRFLFAPSTIGALAWLSDNEALLPGIRAGVIVSCVGDAGPLRYKRSRRARSVVDRAAALVLRGREGSAVTDFVPWGGDERQFCSPGFDLPVGSLTRTPHGAYSEYHSSADDFGLIREESLEGSLAALAEIIETVDANLLVVRVEPHGEPQLSRHGLAGRITRDLLRGGEENRQALLWTLNLADGEHDLIAVCERSGLPFVIVREAAQLLLDAELVREDHS